MNKALTFDDVLMVPKFCEFESRKDVNIETWIENKWKFDVPIISANMNSVTGVEMAKEMGRLGGLGILHRFCTIEDNVKMFIEASEPVVAGDHDAFDSYCKNLVGVSVGVNEGMDRVSALYEAGARIFCIDVAHGHSFLVKQVIKQMRREFPNTCIIAGNVATKEGAEALGRWGASMVKVGIGPGCFVAGTMVTTDKTKKPIEKIKIGDRVLTHMNNYKTVTAVTKRIENDTIIDINGTKCTKNHEFYVISKSDYEKVTDDNIHEYAKWVSAENLSDEYFLIKIKE